MSAKKIRLSLVLVLALGTAGLGAGVATARTVLATAGTVPVARTAPMVISDALRFSGVATLDPTRPATYIFRSTQCVIGSDGEHTAFPCVVTAQNTTSRPAAKDRRPTTIRHIRRLSMLSARHSFKGVRGGPFRTSAHVALAPPVADRPTARSAG
jgi:hypothetical protein